MLVWLTRVASIAVGSALLVGCAIVYRDAETGALHAWGTAHLATRATASNEGKKAVVSGVTTYGVAIGIWDRMPFIALGWQRMQTAEVVDENTAVRIEAPHGDLLQTGSRVNPANVRSEGDTTMRGRAIRCLLVSSLVFNSGCGIGYNRMLFFTKTNIGMDVDTKPPTAEITVARREAVIAPTFEGGKTPPVLGGLRYTGSWWWPKISGVFSGGKSAITIAKLFTSESTTDPGGDSHLCVASAPKSRILHFFSMVPVLGALTEEGDGARPFFFATDTATGLKVAWSGATAAFPDSFKLGYNRKDFAYAPVFGQDNTKGNRDGQDKERKPGAEANEKNNSEVKGEKWNGEDANKGESACPQYQIDVPSFIATLDYSIDAKTLETEKGKDSYQFVQFFATGAAADALALQPAVRRALGERMDPTAFQQAKEDIEWIRKETPPLLKEANEKINALSTEAQLDWAREKAVAAGVLAPGENFPAGSDVAAQKTFLKEAAKPGDDKVRLEALRRFVALLKA